MNILDGFKIYRPDIFVPWGINEDQFYDLFKEIPMRQGNIGSYSFHCYPFNDMMCLMAFRFDGKPKGKLKQLVFSTSEFDNHHPNFQEFQEMLEKAFGFATIASKDQDGQDHYEWRLGRVNIQHYIFERFGPEEHLWIKKRL